MTGDGWDALKTTSSDELIALSSVGGITDPDLDDACTDIRARAFVSTFKPVSHEGTVLAPPRPPEDPADLSHVHADDVLLDAIGAGDKAGEFKDDNLTALLQAWRQDVEEEPIGELVDPKLAIVIVRGARLRQRSGLRLLPLIATAAAIIAIVFSGLGLAARDAEPGDTLWGISRVLYTDHARSVEAAKQVRADLEEAEKALAANRSTDAMIIMGRIPPVLSAVAREDGRATLQVRYDLLAARLGLLPALPEPEGGG